MTWNGKATARKAPGKLSHLAAESIVEDLCSFLLLHCYFQPICLAQANSPLTLRMAAVAPAITYTSSICPMGTKWGYIDLDDNHLHRPAESSIGSSGYGL